MLCSKGKTDHNHHDHRKGHGDPPHTEDMRSISACYGADQFLCTREMTLKDRECYNDLTTKWMFGVQESISLAVQELVKTGAD